jgi:hypothetical protein
MISTLTGCGSVEWFPANTGSAGVAIATLTLADAPTGIAYNQALTASGGTGTLTWSLANNTTLPQGLTLNTDGTITGTPNAITTNTSGTGTFTFTAKVTDSAATPSTTTKDLSIFVPTTGRMFDSTGKAYAENLGVDASQNILMTITNQDTVQRTILVTVADYDTNGSEIAGSVFNMAAQTLAAGASVNASNAPFTTFTTINWRIKKVTMQ